MRLFLRAAGVVALTVGLAACGDPGGKPDQLTGATADLVDPAGRKIGEAEFAEGDPDTGVVIRIRAWGLTPGVHALHICELGRSEPPDFATAGGHFNPERKKHGLKNPQGPHAGDLPNLDVPASGRIDVTFTDRMVTLHPGTTSLLGTWGTTLVIHANPDDGVTDPDGNSGPRIACGVIHGPPPADIEVH